MEIERKAHITYEDFIKNYFNQGIPVIFTEASKGWKALELFSTQWLKQNFGDRKTVCDGKEYTMNEIINLVENSTTDNPAPYPFTFNIPNQIPELMQYMNPIYGDYAKPNWLDSRFFQRGNWGNAIDIFIGGPGGKFPYVHLDYYHLGSWVTMLYGEKRFTIFPRGQDELLYPDPEHSWRSKMNVFEPDYEKYPKFKDATPYNFTLKPGETIYIPFGIWHTANSLTPSISVAFDQLTIKNAGVFIKDVWMLKKRFSRVRAAANTVYAIFACFACWMGDVAGIKRGFLQGEPKKK